TDGLAVPVPANLPKIWGLTDGTPEHAWVSRRLTPHPLGSYTTRLKLDNEIGNGIRRTYIHCTDPSHPIMERSRAWVRAQQDWGWVNLAAPHEAHITHPDLVAETLLKL